MSYGLQINSSNGTEVFGTNLRPTHIVKQGAVTVPSLSSVTVFDVDGMTPSNEADMPIVISNDQLLAPSVTRGTDQFSFFSIGGTTVSYMVARLK